MELNDKFTIIENHHKRLHERYDSLGTIIAQLTALGCIDATEYWKDGKYLYLLRSMKHGKRMKTYVGNQPPRIEEARIKVRNFKKRLHNIQTQEIVTREIIEIERMIRECMTLCSMSNMSVLFAMEDIEHGYNNEIPAGKKCTQEAS